MVLQKGMGRVGAKEAWKAGRMVFLNRVKRIERSEMEL